MSSGWVGRERGPSCPPPLASSRWAPAGGPAGPARRRRRDHPPAGGGPARQAAPAPRAAVAVTPPQRRDELLRSLALLRALPEQPHGVVVDNGPTDGTAAAVRARFPEVELIASRVNLGAVGR